MYNSFARANQLYEQQQASGIIRYVILYSKNKRHLYVVVIVTAVRSSLHDDCAAFTVVFVIDM